MVAYAVSSEFESLAARQTQNDIVRRFTIGSSDYSDYVLKWPKFKADWQKVRAANITINLSNEDKLFNFFIEDKTKIIQDAKIEVGYDGLDRSNQLLAFDYINSSDVTSFGNLEWEAFCISHDGQNAYRISDTNPGLIYRFFITDSHDFRTNSDASENYDAYGTDGVWGRGIGINGDGTRMVITQAYSFTTYQLSPAYSIESMSVLGHGTLWAGVESNWAGAFLTYSGDALYTTSRRTDNQWFYRVPLIDSDVRSMGTDTHFPFNLTGTMLNIQPSLAGDKIWIGAFEGINVSQMYEYIVPDSSDISSCYYSGNYLSMPDSDYPTQFSFNPAGTILNIGKYREDVLTIDVSSEEMVTLFSGKTDYVKYSDTVCNVTLADKFRQLSERVVGTSDDPVVFSGGTYLPSDIAWTLITSYGGYSDIKSAANQDINYEAFLNWADVFSSSSIFMDARFDGSKVTEALRKLARMTRSTIHISNDHIDFHRFSLADSHSCDIDEDCIIKADFTLDDSKFVNRQYVFADYNVTNGSFAITVSDESSSSVNSYGLKEDTESDENVWYVNSVSATDLAQRITNTIGEPYIEANLQVGMKGMIRQVGETVSVSWAHLGIAEGYRIMSQELDIDKMTANLKGDRSQIFGGFILDTSSLNGEDVLL